MTLAARAAEVKDVLESVGGIGIVHGYTRFARRWSEVLGAFRSGDIINASMISRNTSVSRQISTDLVERAHILAINSVYGLNDDDASETTFQDLIEAQHAAFVAYEPTWSQADITSHPIWGPMSGAVGLQIDTIDIRLFGEVLCHYAACRICIVEPE